MPAWNVVTFEFDIPVGKLLNRRVCEQAEGCAVTETAHGALLSVRGGKAVERAADAIARLLCRDLQYFVLAKMADALPLDLFEKQQVLTEALQAARAREELAIPRTDLTAYLKTAETVCLEGYLQFRMQDLLMLWQLCEEQAAAAVLVQKEYGDLIETLKAYVRTRHSRVRELMVCIHKDGSCTLTDDSNVRIEYVDCAPDGIVSLLVNMAPQKLLVYDLSGDSKNRLTETLARIFADRVHIYR